MTITDNDSDILFSSFPSVSMKYASELSGNHKQRHSSKSQQQPDSTTTNTTASELSSNDVSRTNSCSECFHPDNIIRINSPSGFQPLSATDSMPVPTTNNEIATSSARAIFGSDKFEPLLVSSDELSSESSLVITKTNPTIFTPSDKLLLSRKNSSSSSSLSSSLQTPTMTTNTNEKKQTAPMTTSTPTTSTTNKHHKQRKTSIKLLEQQNAHDSGDDNQQQQQQQKGKPRHYHHHHHHHKKGRPRALSPLKPKPSSTLPTQATGMNSPSDSKQTENSSTTTNENEFKKSASSNSLVPPSIVTKSNTTNMSINNPNKPIKYNNQQQQQQRAFPRSLSKSFSSSSSSSSPPPPMWFTNPSDDRSYRHMQRHNMAVSPLERDTTLKAQQQNSYSSSFHSPMYSLTNQLRPPIIIRRGPRSFGFTLRAVKVFHGNTDYYTTQHVIVAVEGPAEEAGLRPNDVITHVNDRPVAGLLHSEVVKLILSGPPKLSIRAIPQSETQIRTGGRRRSPSKQKNRHQQYYDNNKKTQTNYYSSHQPYCQKSRAYSSGNSINMNSNTNPPMNLNKKHPQNNSLFRRLSERKVAHNMEAAAAAAAASPTTIPMNLPPNNINNNHHHHHPNNPHTVLTSTNTSALSSSLPVLVFNQSTHDAQSRPNILDSSEWPPLQAPLKPPTPTGSEPDSPQPTLLPALVKQKSQVYTFFLLFNSFLSRSLL